MKHVRIRLGIVNQLRKYSYQLGVMLDELNVPSDMDKVHLYPTLATVIVGLFQKFRIQIFSHVNIVRVLQLAKTYFSTPP